MDREKGIAYCGLACCLCDEHEGCRGCRTGGCPSVDVCRMFACCRKKGIEGCWECSDFPCDDPLFAKVRNRAFVRFVARFGREGLMDALARKEKAGLLYHYPESLTGDYDEAKSEEAVIALLTK